MISLPDVAADSAPSDEVSFGLDLRVENRLHAVIVKAVRLAEVDDREAVSQIRSHILYLYCRKGEFEMNDSYLKTT